MGENSQKIIFEILEYWFSEPVRKLWFNSTAEFDQELISKYQTLFNKAEKGELDHWADTPEGALALVIIFDQFPLNMFRNQAKSYATEQKAVRVANDAINNRFDDELEDEQKAFLYLPFMHSEHIHNQNRAVELFQKAHLADNLKYAIHHRNIVQKFGRFPHRNKILGRVSSDEELAYLSSKEAFLG